MYSVCIVAGFLLSASKDSPVRYVISSLTLNAILDFNFCSVPLQQFLWQRHLSRVHSFIRSFVRSFVRSFLPSFIHSFCDSMDTVIKTTIHRTRITCFLEARKTCYRVLRTSIWSILYYEELCNKNCIVKTSETMIVWSTFCCTAGSDKSDAIEGCQTNC